MNARKYRQPKQAKEADRLGPKGMLPGGILPTVPTRTHGGRCTERTYLIPRTHCRTWKSCQPRPASRPSGHYRKACQEEQHGEDRKSQSRSVTLGISLRRSGLAWQEKVRNHLRKNCK